MGLRVASRPFLLANYSCDQTLQLLGKVRLGTAFSHYARVEDNALKTGVTAT